MLVRNIFIAALAATNIVQALELTMKADSASAKAMRTLGSILERVNSMFNSQSTSCPAVWSEISTILTSQFLADGECTDAARAAIRGSFHDCFNGACDGSLILADECTTRPENKGLERLCDKLGNLAEEKEVGVADLIQFAAAHAIKTCPGGPTVPVKVGRIDSEEANEGGVLPSGFADGGDIFQLFGKSRIFSIQ